MSNETRRCEWCGDIAQGLCGCPAEIEIAQLRADNATFRNAQRACEHCDPDGHSAAVAAERDRWRNILAESCADERSQLFEAGPGGGCDRAITAEAEIERLRAALVECHARPIDRCQCGYPMPCAASVPIGFCRANSKGNRI